jgi:hypothetical protein
MRCFDESQDTLVVGKGQYVAKIMPCEALYNLPILIFANLQQEMSTWNQSSCCQAG